MKMPVCPDHGKPARFPCCAGAKGGESKSTKKVRASRRNGKQRVAATKE